LRRKPGLVKIFVPVKNISFGFFVLIFLLSGSGASLEAPEAVYVYEAQALDSDGAPFSGVEIIFLDGNIMGSVHAAQKTRLEALLSDLNVIAAAKSGASGKFTLRMSGKNAALGGFLVFRGSQVTPQVEWVENFSDAPLRWTISTRIRTTGRLMNAAGEPVKNGRLLFHPVYHRNGVSYVFPMAISHMEKDDAVVPCFSGKAGEFRVFWGKIRNTPSAWKPKTAFSIWGPNTTRPLLNAKANL
jgi:hypothetical protein